VIGSEQVDAATNIRRRPPSTCVFAGGRMLPGQTFGGAMIESIRLGRGAAEDGGGKAAYRPPPAAR